MSNTEPDLTRTYSTEETAERLGVTVPTIRSWIHTGQLRALTVRAFESTKNGPPKYRITEPDLVDFIQARTVAPRKKAPIA